MVHDFIIVIDYLLELPILIQVPKSWALEYFLRYAIFCEMTVTSEKMTCNIFKKSTYTWEFMTNKIFCMYLSNLETLILLIHFIT